MSVLRVMLVLLGLILPLGAHAGNTLGSPNMPEVMQENLGTFLRSYAVHDCLPVVPTTSLTLAATPCTAMVLTSQTPPRLIPVVQAATGLGPLNAGDGTYWLAVHIDTSTALGGWTRTAGGANRTGSHFLWKLAATQPAVPSNGMLLAKMTVAGSVITAIADLRVPLSLVQHRGYDPTDTLYGADPTGLVDATSAIQAAEDARSVSFQLYGQTQGNVLALSAGTYFVSAPIVLKAAGMVRGQGRTNTVLVATNLAGDTFTTAGFAGGAFSNLTIRDLMLTASAVKTAGAAIHAVTATPTEAGQQYLVVTDIRCEAHFECIRLSNSAYARIAGNVFGGVQHTGIVVGTTSFWDAGDNVIDGNTFATSPTIGVQAMLLQTSGQRVTNNKILGFPLGIVIDPLVAPALGDILIAQNSIEHFSQYAILAQTSLEGTQIQNLHIMGNQIAVPEAPGHAAIGVSGQVINAVISGNIIYHALPNVFGIELSTNILGHTPTAYAITGNVVSGQNGTASIGIQVPFASDNLGIVSGNFVSGWPHPYAGLGGAFMTGVVPFGNLVDFGGQGSIVPCVNCGVTSSVNNTCAENTGTTEMAIKLEDGAWHCLARQN